jgi:hypothetical protein
MPTIQIEADLSSEQLLSAARQLPPHEFDRLFNQLTQLRAERVAPVLSAAESRLLRQINLPLPTEIQQRYDALLARRDAQLLTEAEHVELLQLTDQVESLEAERMGHLIELAQVRHVSLDELLVQLGLQPLTYA